MRATISTRFRSFRRFVGALDQAHGAPLVTFIKTAGQPLLFDHPSCVPFVLSLNLCVHASLFAMGGVISAVVCIAAAVLPMLRGRPKQPPPQIVNPTPAATLSQEEMIAQARAKHNIDVVNNYNFAVCGQTGSGKSTLINAIRGLPDGHPDAAPVDEIECTAAIKSYPMPDMPHVLLWDMPGAGTAAHPAETYFHDKTLYAFDFLIVVTAERFTEAELDIGKKASKWGVPIVFVRQKFDISFASLRRRSREPTDDELKAQLRQTITSNIQEQLGPAALGDRKIYIVSALAMRGEEGAPTMDEAQLVADIGTTAAERRRR